MTRTTPKLSPQIVEEASDWFVEFSEGNVDAGAREQFDIWLRRSPEHVQAYLKITALWEEAPVLEKRRVLSSDELVARVLAEGNIVPLQAAGGTPSEPPYSASPSRRSDTTSIESVVGVRPNGAAKVEGSQSASTRAPIRALREKLFGIAAAAVLALATCTWFYVQRGTYATAIGEQRSVRLDDGSTVDLNSQSKVRVRFSEHRRDVELLEGQALFRVAKDQSRPFVVTTGNTHVRAVGTQFDVYRKGSGTVVTVLEGRVAVLSDVKSTLEPDTGGSAKPEGDAFPNVMVPNAALLHEGAGGAPGSRGKGESSPQGRGIPKLQTSPPPDPSGSAGASAPNITPPGLTATPGEVLLAAGEQLTVSPGAVSQPTPADLAIATAWTQRKIAFHGAPLSEVVEEFNRYNTRPLVISDPGLRSTRISGVFSSTDPDSLLRFLSALPNIEVQETPHEIRISRK